MKKQSFFGTLCQIVLIAVLLLAIVFVAAFASRFTNGFTGGLISFYLQAADGEQISGESEREFKRGEKYMFSVVYTFGFMGGENDYTVQVVPKITKTTNFDYSVDGSYHQYKEVEDLTLYFDIEKHEDYFTVAANMDLPDMFRLIYPNKTLTGVPTATDSENIYFTLIVNSVAEANVRIDMKRRGKSA